MLAANLIKIIKMKHLLLTLVCIICGIQLTYGATIKPKVVIYPAPAGEQLSAACKVSIFGRNVPVYIARVSARDRLKHKINSETDPDANTYEEAAFAYFDMEGAIKVTITVPGNVNTAKILPSSANIKASLSLHSISFTIDKPQNLTIEVNGETVQSLHLFANPLETDVPKPGDPNVVFFGPGIHLVSHLDIGDNKTVYIAGGGIVRAVIDSAEHYSVNPKDHLRYYSPTFNIRGNHISFRGRGIIDAGACPIHARNMLMIHGNNFRMEGVILRDASTWFMPVRQSDNVTIDNVKIIGYRANSDGIDICNSRDVLVKNCFIRTYDDLIVVKADKGQGGVKRITARNCVLWNELAHALSVGAEIRDPVDSVLFTDCDIIHDHGREWSLRIYQCDAAVVSHIRFENIRIEESKRLISLWIGKAIWSRDTEYGHVQDVSFKNITATGSPLNVELVGIDDQHQVQNASFDHVLLNGIALTKELIKANAFVKDVSVRP